MSTVRWRGPGGTVTAPTSGSFTTASNWYGGLVPGSSDDAIVPASSAASGYGVTFYSNTLISMKSLVVTSKNTLFYMYNFSMGLALSSGGSNAGTISVGYGVSFGGHSASGATFINSGSIETAGTIAFDSLINEGTIISDTTNASVAVSNVINDVNGSIIAGYNRKIDLVGNFTNEGIVAADEGTVELGTQTSNLTWSSANAGILTGGTWEGLEYSDTSIIFETDHAGGIAELGSGTTITYDGFLGTLAPDGTRTDLGQSLTTIDAGASLTLVFYHEFTNAIDLKGSLTLEGFYLRAVLTVEQGAVITETGQSGIYSDVDSSGSIVIATQGELRFFGDDTFGGAFSGLGSIIFLTGSDRLNAGASVKTSELRLDGADVTLGTNLTFARSFEMSAGSLVLDGHSLRLKQTGTAEFSGGYVGGTGALILLGVSTIDGYFFLTGAATMSNSGALTASSSMEFGSTVRFVNQAGASFALAGTSGISLLAETTAAGAFVNEGSLTKASGLWADTIAVDLINSGTVTVGAGTLGLSGVVFGAGTISIDNDAKLEIANRVTRAQTVSFAAGGTGTLQIDLGTIFGGTVAGFAAGDTIELSHFAATGASVSLRDGTEPGTSILDVARGTQHVALTLDGQFIASGFALAKDNPGTGTAITYTPPTLAATHLAAAHL